MKGSRDSSNRGNEKGSRDSSNRGKDEKGSRDSLSNQSVVKNDVRIRTPPKPPKPPTMADRIRSQEFEREKEIERIELERKAVEVLHQKRMADKVALVEEIAKQKIARKAEFQRRINEISEAEDKRKLFIAAEVLRVAQEAKAEETHRNTIAAEALKASQEAKSKIDAANDAIEAKRIAQNNNNNFVQQQIKELQARGVQLQQHVQQITQAAVQAQQTLFPTKVSQSVPSPLMPSPLSPSSFSQASSMPSSYSQQTYSSSSLPTSHVPMPSFSQPITSHLQSFSFFPPLYFSPPMQRMPMYQDMSYQQQQRSQMQSQQMQSQQMQSQQQQQDQSQQEAVLFYQSYQPYQYQAIVNPNYHFEGIPAPQQTQSLQENHLQRYTETNQQTIPYQTELLIQQQMQQQPKQSLQEALNVVGQALQTNVTRTTSQQKAFVDLVSSMGEGLTAITGGGGGGGRIHSIAGQSSTSLIADVSATGSTATFVSSASSALASSTSATLASTLLLASSTIHKPNTSTSPWIPVLVSVPISVPVPTTVRVSTSTRPLPILTRPSLAPLSSPTSTLPKKSSRVELID